MRKLVLTLRQNILKKSILFFFILSIAIVVIIFPKEAKFKYEYQKGAPWPHENLIAPYNFPIYKTESELRHEKDSIDNITIPYYKYDDFIGSNQIKLFKQGFQYRWYINFTRYQELMIDNKFADLIRDSTRYRRLQNKYREKIIVLLTLVYKKGIVEGPELKEKQTITIVKNSIGEETEISEIFALKSAYEFIFNELSEQSTYTEKLKEDELAFLKEMNINDFLLPNCFYDEFTSNKVKQSFLEGISLTSGMVQQGEIIILKGEIVTFQKMKILNSLKKEYETNTGNTRSSLLLILGQIMFVFSAFLMLYLFLHTFRRDILKDFAKSIFLLQLIILFVFIGNLVINSTSVSIFLLPFAIIAIIVRIFFDTRLALFVHLIATLLVGFLAPNGFKFVFMQFITGVVAIISLKNLRSRGQLLMTSLLIFIMYSFVYFSIAIIQEGDLEKLELMNFAWFAANALLLLLTYPLIWVYERLFGFLSDVTLIELSDTNNPLMRMLAEQAPGTFQHSLQVANLAEDVIYRIGGNMLLVRAGALYHDIGKLGMPQFFAENQISGLNPHEQLDFETSAAIIISHVNRGIEIAQKYKLPEPIIDFIRTHHGNSKVQYFLRSYISKFPEKEVDINQFTYPFPRPFSKETAVLMMADAIEAASRSLKILKEESVSDLVNKIIDYQIQEEQFNDSNLTFRDITTIKNSFKQKLKNIYHARIEYPK